MAFRSRTRNYGTFQVACSGTIERLPQRLKSTRLRPANPEHSPYVPPREGQSTPVYVHTLKTPSRRILDRSCGWTLTCGRERERERVPERRARGRRETQHSPFRAERDETRRERECTGGLRRERESCDSFLPSLLRERERERETFRSIRVLSFGLAISSLFRVFRSPSRAPRTRAWCRGV